MKGIQAKKHKIGTYEINKTSLLCFEKKDLCQMIEFILWLIFIRIVIIEKDCDNWKRLQKKFMLVIRQIFSSNINEGNQDSFTFFYEKILHAQKSTKSTKSIKSTKRKQVTCTQTLFTRIKKHKKHANKRISDYFPLRCFLNAFKTVFFVFVPFLCFLCFFYV